MGLDTLIAGAVATAKRVTGKLLAEVSHTPATALSGYGPTLGSPVTRKALVEEAIKPIRLADGTERVSIAKLTFLEPVSVTPDDRFTLPSGVTGPVLRTGGLVNPTTKQAFLTEVWLGSETTQRS